MKTNGEVLLLPFDQAPIKTAPSGGRIGVGNEEGHPIQVLRSIAPSYQVIIMETKGEVFFPTIRPSSNQNYSGLRFETTGDFGNGKAVQHTGVDIIKISAGKISYEVILCRHQRGVSERR